MDGLDFINARELAVIMRCSVTEARNVMHRPDFPMIKVGREMRVTREALAEWAKERRD